MQISQTRDYHLSVDWLSSFKLSQTSLSIMCMSKLTQTSLVKFVIRSTLANFRQLLFANSKFVKACKLKLASVTRFKDLSDAETEISC